MPRKITLESIIDKIEDKDFFYLSIEEQRSYFRSNMIADLYSGKVDYNDRKNFNPFRDIDDLLQGLTTANILANKYKLDESIKENIQAGYEEYELATEPLLKKYFVGLTKEELTTLNTYATRIDFALKLFLPPTNSKNNFLTITNANNIDFSARRWRTHIYEIFVARLRVATIPTGREELFNLLKNELLGFYDRLKASKQAKEELQALTFKEIKYKPRTNKKSHDQEEKIIDTPVDDIAIIFHSDFLDAISSLSLVGEQENIIAGTTIKIWENEYIEARTTIPQGVKLSNLKEFGILADKILLLARYELCKDYNEHFRGDFTLEMTIERLMLLFGYTKEEALNYDSRYNFMKQTIVPCLALLRHSDFVCKQDPTRKVITLINAYAQERKFSVTFTEACSSLRTKKTPYERILVDILKIPTRKKVEYYLARKLLNYCTNKTNIARGNEDIISIKALYDYLNEKATLSPNDKTRNKQLKQIDRIIQAFEYLEEIGFAEFTFLNANKLGIKDNDLSYYRNNAISFKELMTEFVIFKMKPFIEGKRLDYEQEAKDKQEKAIENAIKKENAKIKALAQLEAKKEFERKQKQEQEQEKEENSNSFVDTVNKLL